jgi:hypothetical protein
MQLDNNTNSVTAIMPAIMRWEKYLYTNINIEYS